jgi:hypothetical protein
LKGELSDVSRVSMSVSLSKILKGFVMRGNPSCIDHPH